MTPPIDVRLRALQRDVTRFQRRVDRVAAHLPELPADDPRMRREVRPLYGAAAGLQARSDALRGAMERHGGTGAGQAWHGALAVLNEGRYAERTVGQRTLVGEHGHAEITFSSVRPHSEASANAWSRAIDDRDLPNVRMVGKVPQPAINNVADRLENVPATTIETTDALGARAALFSGKLTDVWGYMSLRGVHPRGWPKGATWDIVPGAGGDGGFAANPSREDRGRGHGSTSLSLHEYGHTVDFSLARPREEVLSEAPRFRRGPWRELRRRERPSIYLKTYPVEWFAEAFARYTKTPQSSAALARWYPQTYDFLKRELGSPQF